MSLKYRKLMLRLCLEPFHDQLLSIEPKDGPTSTEIWGLIQDFPGLCPGLIQTDVIFISIVPRYTHRFEGGMVGVEHRLKR